MCLCDASRFLFLHEFVVFPPLAVQKLEILGISVKLVSEVTITYGIFNLFKLMHSDFPIFHHALDGKNLLSEEKKEVLNYFQHNHIAK